MALEDWAVEWLTARQASEADLVLITITSNYFETFRLARNRQDVISRGQTFTRCWLEVDILSDDDQITRSTLTLPNVSREISRAMRSVIGPPEVTIEVINSARPDTPFYRAARLKLRNVQFDPFFITGDLSRGDENTEICGTIKITPARAPAIFRL